LNQYPSGFNLPDRGWQKHGILCYLVVRRIFTIQADERLYVGAIERVDPGLD
jgi:hypothetical protein